MVKVGHVARDGTKVQANASKRKAMSPVNDGAWLAPPPATSCRAPLVSPSATVVLRTP